MDEILNSLKISFIKISNIIRNNEDNALFKSVTLTNSSGDKVKKLDITSNDILKNNLKKIKSIRAIGSEEDKEIIFTDNNDGKYLICFDPLDGSSNIDVNITVGTIFAIYKYNDNNIINGNNIIMAGYCLYGSSTQLVIADSEVNIYQLDSNNKFNLVFKNWKIPEKGVYYSINESNKYLMDDKYLKLIDKFINLNYSTRWVASLVADAHRTLMKGGFFSYPENSKNKDGKIRLLYEAYPMAYIFEIAGGKSSDGKNCLLNVPFPQNIHQKTPIILSSIYEFEIFNSL